VRLRVVLQTSFLGLALMAAASSVSQVHKCVAPSGTVEFTNKPCPSDSTGQRIHVQPNTLDTSGERVQSLKSENQRLRDQLAAERGGQQPQSAGTLGGSYGCEVAMKNYSTTLNSRYKGRRDNDAEAERIAMYKACGLREPDTVILHAPPPPPRNARPSLTNCNASGCVDTQGTFYPRSMCQSSGCIDNKGDFITR
jgi:hypothetical protein